MDVRQRFNVRETGNPDGPTMLFVHGFGCDQSMWRALTPSFEQTARIVTLDLAGLGRSDRSSFEPERYGTLDAYAEDIVAVLDGLDLTDVVYVGHSVSAMIGVLAAGREPARFRALVLICPSPRYVDDVGYVGGFSRRDIDELLESLEDNYLGWSAAMAPVIMGNPDRPELGEELRNLFCQADPLVLRTFARATFLSDNRADLAEVSRPTLILQCREDAVAPTVVGEYVQRNIAGSKLVTLDATGHCPNLSAPDATAAAIAVYLHERDSADRARTDRARDEQ